MKNDHNGLRGSHPGVESVMRQRLCITMLHRVSSKGFTSDDLQLRLYRRLVTVHGAVNHWRLSAFFATIKTSPSSKFPYRLPLMHTNGKEEGIKQAGRQGINFHDINTTRPSYNSVS